MWLSDIMNAEETLVIVVQNNAEPRAIEPPTASTLIGRSCDRLDGLFNEPRAPSRTCRLTQVLLDLTAQVAVT